MMLKIAETDLEVKSCFPVMKELRKDLVAEGFVRTIRGLQANGYILVYLEVADQVVALAGFRLGENLAWKRFLYVDDLVTSSEVRSKGYGKKLLDWLFEYARANNCDTFHLDSGVQRKDAHRFYEREGLPLASYHFATDV